MDAEAISAVLAANDARAEREFQEAVSKRQVRVIRDSGSLSEETVSLRGVVADGRGVFPIGSDIRVGDVVELPGRTPERRGVVDAVRVHDQPASRQFIEVSLAP